MVKSLLKEVSVAKKKGKHAKPFSPAKTKSKQTRKGGKGSALNHAAARPQSHASAAASNHSPSYPAVSKPAANRADAELALLQKRNGGGMQ